MTAYLIPNKYTSMTLEEFLAEHLNAYPSVEESLKKLTDTTSDEYKTFHMLSIKRHVHSMEIKQRGKTYQFYRMSSIRGTAGYERYTYRLWNTEPHQEDDANIVYRYFFERWDEWVTIPLKK